MAADTASLVLAPGASATPASLRRHVAALRERGLEARVIALPKGTAERAVAAYRHAVPPSVSTVIGGQSFGGRVASLLAADEPYAGLVLFSYPLHAPGRAERWEERTSHWPRIECPVLLLSGDRDPFARIVG
jgi:predicted alpha/beta-hydrolase family hydrolase